MDTTILISVLAWGLVTVGGGLVTAIVWFGLRVVNQIDKQQIALIEMDRRVLVLETSRSLGDT